MVLNVTYFGRIPLRCDLDTCTGQLFCVRLAVRIPCRYEALRCDKNKDAARIKNVYEKYTKMCTKFVPYLVRNSPHLRGAF